LIRNSKMLFSLSETVSNRSSERWEKSRENKYAASEADNPSSFKLVQVVFLNDSWRRRAAAGEKKIALVYYFVRFSKKFF
jgi:hypothetical protein